jgi:hypothetical protein
MNNKIYTCICMCVCVCVCVCKRLFSLKIEQLFLIYKSNLWHAPVYRNPYSILTIHNLTIQRNPKGSDDGVQHSESLGFWTLAIARNSEY